MSKSVPARPNLEFDRKQARSLFEAIVAGRPEAIRRFEAAHPAGVPQNPRLADALCVVAREYGFPSWPAWKSYVETRSLNRQHRIDVVLKAVCSNDVARARAVLRDDPDLPAEDFFLACACGEMAAVEKFLARDSGWATRSGGVNGWEAIQYACFSRWLRCDAERTRGIVEVVSRLLALGADPNAYHMITWMDEPWKETVLFAASGIANNPELTRMLLEAGADVNERLPEPDLLDPAVSPWGTEVLYHTCEFRDTACLQLLLAARPRSICVSYCLARVLDFEYPKSVTLMLAHGADPNFRYEGKTHLHRAVQNGRSAEVIRALIEAGADVEATDSHGVTAFQYAVRFGRKDAAALFPEKAARFCTGEDLALGRIMSGDVPEERLETIHPDLLCLAAKSNDTVAIERLVSAGADINACDASKYGVPALHWAAWRGRFAALKCLVENGADIHFVNVYGGAALGTAIHGSENCFDPEGGPAMRLPEEAINGEYPAIVEYLIAAGSLLPETVAGSAAVQEVLRRHGVSDEIDPMEQNP